MEPQSSTGGAPPSGGTARGLTLLVTNATKLVGVAVVFNEALLRGELRPVALAVAAFMMAGAQVSERTLLAAIDKFLGK